MRALSLTRSLALSRFVLFTNLRWNDDEVELSGASIVSALVSCPVDLPQARRVRARFVSSRRKEGTEQITKNHAITRKQENPKQSDNK